MSHCWESYVVRVDFSTALLVCMNLRVSWWKWAIFCREAIEIVVLLLYTRFFSGFFHLCSVGFLRCSHPLLPLRSRSAQSIPSTIPFFLSPTKTENKNCSPVQWKEKKWQRRRSTARTIPLIHHFIAIFSRSLRSCLHQFIHCRRHADTTSFLFPLVLMLLLSANLCSCCHPWQSHEYRHAWIRRRYNFTWIFSCEFWSFFFLLLFVDSFYHSYST